MYVHVPREREIPAPPPPPPQRTSRSRSTRTRTRAETGSARAGRALLSQSERASVSRGATSLRTDGRTTDIRADLSVSLACNEVQSVRWTDNFTDSESDCHGEVTTCETCEAIPTDKLRSSRHAKVRNETNDHSLIPK